MAEHMLILKLTSPEGEVKYVTGAFPSACGKTNLAMLIPTLPDWTVETVGDDIAWMKFGDDGRLYAVNPEAGFFGVAPEHQPQDQPERDGHDRAQLDLHQLRAHRRRRHLVGGDDRRAAGARDRLEGQRLDARLRGARRPPERPVHRPRRRSAPSIAPEWEDPAGVPIDAFLFGGRRATVVPLVSESFDWEHGVFLGRDDVVGDDRRAPGEVGQLRFDPMAMLPFCGYNMADYFEHWLEIGAQGRFRTSCRGSSSSTGSARTPTASSSGPASARTAACSSGSSAAATARARRSRRRSASCRPRASSTSTASRSPTTRCASCSTVDAEKVREQLPQVEEFLASSATGCRPRSGGSSRR